MGDHRRFYLVTRNPGKYVEALELLKGYCIELEAAAIDKLEIQSDDIAYIALHAARDAYKRIRKPVLVDDSGLFIESLKGFPGPYSSYTYKTIGIEGILKLMTGITNRRACFKTALAVVGPAIERVYLGEVCGVIAGEPRGQGGFGFDPIFIPEGSHRTFAEMDVREKNRFSHRARAFKAFAEDVCEGDIQHNPYSPHK